MSKTPYRFPNAPLSAVLSLEYGAALPESARTGVGFPVFGSNGVVGHHSSYLVEGPGIIVGRKGSVGRVCWSAEPFWPIDTAYYLTAKDQTCLRWLYWLLSSMDLGRLDATTGVPGLNRNDVYEVRAPLPSPAEQSRIAAVLDTVDEAIAKTEAVIVKLKQVRAGLLHDLLTGGLDEHGQIRDPIAHPEQFTDSPVGCVPKEWTCSRFDKVLDGIDAGKSPDYPDQPAAPGDWGVLKVSAIWPEGFRPHENKRVTKVMHQVAAYEIKNGDLLISRANTYELVGLVCLVRNAPPHLMLCDKTLRLRLKAELGINPFFELLLQTRTARNQIEIHATGTSGSMKNISQEIIRALCLAYPKVEEQRRIVAAVSPAYHKLDALRHEFNKLVQLKSGLMADLLTGRVRVPEGIAVEL